MNTTTGPRPKHGSLYFFDYTDEQIEAMDLPAWQKPMVVAMSHYGGYVGDTGLSLPLPLSLSLSLCVCVSLTLCMSVQAAISMMGRSPAASKAPKHTRLRGSSARSSSG